ncbi:MAG: acetylxylan esterase, partial [Lentisphaeria bacterium]|nr:acetylxylan esterase [Lentisphaeria bacterium]
NDVKKELAAVPVKVLEDKPIPADVVKKSRLQNPEKYTLRDVKIACAGEKPVSGYLCIPKGAKPRSCPAYVSFHGAGVRSSGKPVWMAAKGLIALDINAHGIENGKPADFYTDLYKNHYYARQGKTNIRHYAHWGKSDRDQFYFKGMYMRVMRALEYVKSLPEWDGKYLIVAGGSQGGAQVLAACALDKDITFARANVPAMCDHSGCLGDRRSGWPALYKAEEVKTKPEFARCASYYDGAYFAKRIKCPIYINTGFMDTTCPPTSVFAAYNSIPAGVEKAMQTDPQGGHSTPHTDGLKALNRYIDSIMKK